MNSPFRNIEHIVVVMFENRSFDNLLGWLYDPANDAPYDVVPPDFEGLYGKQVSNRTSDGDEIPAGKTEDPRSPQPNPGEPFEDVYSQVFDEPLRPFKETPPNSPHPANMQGFIKNYEVQKHQPKNPAKIMNSLTPAAVPVLSSLAHHYAVCDHWFASIPTQTFCNRSFVHAGTSSGYVNNAGGGICFVNDTLTIFDLLETAKCTWTVFVGGGKVQSFTLWTQRSMWKYAFTDRFAHFDTFIAAARKKGGLPDYSFIEPVYFDSVVWGPETDMHPECNPYELYGPSNLHRGEAFLAAIYGAVRNSPDWGKILLVILFDEHGGCYDHVAPPSSADCPAAINPEGDGCVIPASQPGGIGFNFDRLGPRVPAIVVSAYTRPQTRLHDVFEHTSVLSTIVECFALPRDALRARQTKAPDLRAALNLPSPRQDHPAIARPRRSLFERVKEELYSGLHILPRNASRNEVTELQKAALRGAALMMDSRQLRERVENLQTELDANRLLAEIESRYFSKRAS